MGWPNYSERSQAEITITTLTQERDELKAKLTEANQYGKQCRKDIDRIRLYKMSIRKQLAEARAEVERLREWVNHKNDCAIYKDIDVDCDCGFDELEKKYGTFYNDNLFRRKLEADREEVKKWPEWEQNIHGPLSTPAKSDVAAKAAAFDEIVKKRDEVRPKDGPDKDGWEISLSQTVEYWCDYYEQEASDGECENVRE